ncbi:MAG: hypothetical protein NTZ25_02230 [Candidatus Peregrinibacteria bacterium]|nr:hypothetical protein [Candidatus Peregrinibacteria bacterium]
MESLGSIGKKVMPALAALAMACTTEVPADEQMNTALATLQKETDDLAREFEIAASHAMGTGETFEEQGSGSGEVVLVDDVDTYGCMPSNSGDGIICEKARFTGVSTNPNKVSLDRGESTIVVADKSNVQVVRRYDNGKTQTASTMTLNDKACSITNAKESGSNSAHSYDEAMMQKCATMRDKLKVRLEKVMKAAIVLKIK